jgi:hypothetical protein
MYRTTRGLIVGSSVQPQTVTLAPRAPEAAMS